MLISSSANPVIFKFKDRFQPHRGSILWELNELAQEAKRQRVLQATGKLFDMPRWRATTE